jgi:hypothetical protein
LHGYLWIEVKAEKVRNIVCWHHFVEERNQTRKSCGNFLPSFLVLLIQQRRKKKGRKEKRIRGCPTPTVAFSMSSIVPIILLIVGRSSKSNCLHGNAKATNVVNLH